MSHGARSIVQNEVRLKFVLSRNHSIVAAVDTDKSSYKRVTRRSAERLSSGEPEQRLAATSRARMGQLA